MVTNDTGLLKSIFMFGGAPPRRMLNSVVNRAEKESPQRHREHKGCTEKHSVKTAHKAQARVCRGGLSQPLNQRAILQPALTGRVSPSRSSADPDHEQSLESRQTVDRRRSFSR